MKVTVNGKVSKEALNIILKEQQDKTIIIDNFCKENKLKTIFYKDAELEYEYPRVTPKKVEVETR